MNNSFTLIRKEYQNLCEQLDLDPIPLDVYEYEAGSDEETELGTPKRNSAAGYSQEKLVLPLTDEAMPSTRDPSFPPRTWKRMDPVEWPIWRIELWHEVVHQVEDQKLDNWSPGHEHDDSWSEAIGYVSDAFSVDKEKIEGVM